MKTTYTIDYNYTHDMKFEIDHEVATEEFFHELNNFWSESEDRVDEDGSAFSGVMKLLAAVIFQLTVYPNKNTHGIKKLFQDGQEGWPQLDGSWGIELISTDSFEFDDSEFTITKELAK